MSDGWRLGIVKDFAEVRARIGWRGLSSEEYTEDGPLLIAGKHIADGRIAWAQCDHISKARFLESPEIALRHGDIVVSKDGTIGRVARIDYLPSEATINGTMMLVRPKGGLDYKYLYHLLNGQQFQRLVAEKVSGSSIPHLFQRDVLDLEFDLPPKREQRRIAEILDSVDEYIATAAAIFDKREKVRIGIISDLINSYGSQGMVRLRDVGSIGSGSTPSRGRSDYWVNGTIPWVKTAEVAFSVITDTAEHVTASAVRDCRLSVYPAGTVLVAMYGEGATRGRSAILGVPATVNQACAAITCDTKTLSPEYLFECLKHLYGEIRLLGHGSNQTNLNAEMLGELEVPAPSLEEQEKLTAVMRDFDRESFVLAETLSKARAIKQGLAEDLLTGRVRVPEAEAVVESL